MRSFIAIVTALVLLNCSNRQELLECQARVAQMEEQLNDQEYALMIGSGHIKATFHGPTALSACEGSILTWQNANPQYTTPYCRKTR